MASVGKVLAAKSSPVPIGVTRSCSMVPADLQLAFGSLPLPPQ